MILTLLFTNNLDLGRPTFEKPQYRKRNLTGNRSSLRSTDVFFLQARLCVACAMCCLIEREKRGGGRKKNDGEIRTLAPRVVELHHYHFTTRVGSLWYEAWSVLICICGFFLTNSIRTARFWGRRRCQGEEEEEVSGGRYPAQRSSQKRRTSLFCRTI